MIYSFRFSFYTFHLPEVGDRGGRPLTSSHGRSPTDVLHSIPLGKWRIVWAYKRTGTFCAAFGTFYNVIDVPKQDFDTAAASCLTALD